MGQIAIFLMLLGERQFIFLVILLLFLFFLNLINSLLPHKSSSAVQFTQEKRKERMKEKESKKRKRLLGLLNARVKRVERPDLHVQRLRSHKLEKERRIPQNPLIKGGILREFDVSDRVKECREDGVDDVFKIAFVELVGRVLSRIETRNLPIHLIHGHGNRLCKGVGGISASKLDNRSAWKSPHVVEET